MYNQKFSLMCVTPPYKTVIQARVKNRKQDEKQNTYEYN